MNRFVLLFLVVFLFSNLYAQSIIKTITGIVTNVDGKILIGVSVINEESGKEVSTDDRGNFVMQINTNSTTLSFSYIGYYKKTMTFTPEKKEWVIVLEEKRNDLDKVVVTALGINKSDRSLTYANSVLKGGDFTKARNPNLISGLEGEAVGVNVTTSSTGPTASANVLIRGTTSISGNNQPLYVVDGISLNNFVGAPANADNTYYDKGDGIQNISPDDIESITVLKGGSAVALYGYRASNGVILVTTKKGGKGRPHVEINSTTTIETVNMFPRWQKQYGQGEQGVPYQSLSQLLQGTLWSWGGKLNGQPQLQFDGVYRPYSALPQNNISLFYQPAPSFTNSVSVSGGDTKNNYNVTVTDLQAQSIIPNSTLQRDNFSINANIAPVNKLEVALTAQYIRQYSKNVAGVGAGTGNANYIVPFMPANLDVRLLRINEFNPDGSERSYQGSIYTTNPYWAAYQFSANYTRNRALVGITPLYRFNKSFYVRGRLTLDYYIDQEDANIPSGTRYNIQGTYNVLTLKYRELNGEYLVGYKHDFKQFGIDAFFAGNAQIQYQDISSIGGNIVIPNFYDVSNLSNAFPNNSNIRKTVNSLYGSLELSYHKYLYLSFTGRNDWYSTLGPNVNSLFYPSVGLSFILSDIIKLPNVFDLLKLRTSWASIGGDRSPYTLSLNYGLGQPYNGIPTAGITNGSVPNPNLLPYLVSTFEVGFETQLFHSRLGVDFSYYNKNTTNDIINVPIPGASGFGSIASNVGKVRNRGVELLFTITPIKTRNFIWSASYNFSYNQSKVLALTSFTNSVEIYRGTGGVINYQVGLPVNQLYVSDFLRDNKGNVVTVGGLPQSASTFTSAGTTIPPYTMGITNSFSYKNFSFSFLIDAKFGGVIVSATNQRGTAYGLTQQTLVGREGGLIVQGVNVDGTPNNTVVSAQNYYQTLSTFGAPFVYSSDFIKLRQVIIGYNLPVSYLSKTKFFKGISFSLVARNLLFLKTWSPNINPESANGYTAIGFEQIALPSTLSTGLNIGIKF